MTAMDSPSPRWSQRQRVAAAGIFGAGLLRLLVAMWPHAEADVVSAVAVTAATPIALALVLWRWPAHRGWRVARVVGLLMACTVMLGQPGESLVHGFLLQVWGAAFIAIVVLMAPTGVGLVLAQVVQGVRRFITRRRTVGRSAAPNRAQWTLAALIFALGIGALAYHWLNAEQLEQTAALFIGLPALLAILLALTPGAKSPTGMVMKGMTIALLSSGVLLGEGIVCILMASPLFYLVGLLVGFIIETTKRRRRRTVQALLLIPLLPMSLEGVVPGASFPRDTVVHVERTVQLPDVAIEQLLGAVYPTAYPAPAFLRLGFPRPVSVRAEGLRIGDCREIQFVNRAGVQSGVRLKVVNRSPGYARFAVLADTTHIAHWLAWEWAEVRWTKRADGAVRVEWSVGYRRLLDPAWYFGPLERYGVAQCVGYLMDAALEAHGG